MKQVFAHQAVPVVCAQLDAGMTKKAQSSQPDNSGKAHNGQNQAGHDAIGRRLREFYDDVVNEPVPDDFMDLLSKLDRSEGEDGDDAR